MYCTKCGKEIEEGARFCTSCGEPVDFYYSDTEAPQEPYYGDEGIPSDYFYYGGEEEEPSFDDFATQPLGMDRGYLNMEDLDNPPKRPEKKKSVVPVVLLSIFCVLLAGAVAVMGYKLLKKKEPASGIEIAEESSETEGEDSSRETRAEEQKESSKETEPAPKETFSPKETHAPVQPSAPPETQGFELPYIGASVPAVVSSGSDFVSQASPDGTHTFMYPMDYFYTSEYIDQETSGYTLTMSTADGFTAVKFTKMAAPYQGDAYTNGVSLYKEVYNECLREPTCPYEHMGESADEEGYVHMIIGGPLERDPSRGIYCCIAASDTAVYKMEVFYDVEDYDGIGVDYTRTGYLVDCLYRGWSLSGSTYALRTFDQYMNDDMGDKKPGES
ncbi:MAG: zinc ribbon domain-containing protein [Lachnospiraceae bacterium]|nr:zinc ribbon domain-containing protein [Lachnospiraceae bacterium]